MTRELPPPAFYFPMEKGRFTVTPGLFPLGTDFGNGDADARLFQIDNDVSYYRANKMACRAERFGKYVLHEDFDARTQEAASRLIVSRLTAEYPALFVWEDAPNGAGKLRCFLTSDILQFDAAMRLRMPTTYTDAFDALCCQIPEDIAIVRRTAERGEWIAALHLCAPSHWAAADKIGRPFVAVHAPVPHFEKIAAVADSLTETLIRRGPYVRFAWSVAMDNRLNAHPEPPPRLGPEIWDGESPLFLRVERQTLWGLPNDSDKGDAYLFAIRIYLYDARDRCADPARRDALLAALRSMSPESRRYKGLAAHADAMMKYLEE